MSILEKYPANYTTWTHPNLPDPLQIAQFEDKTVIGFNGFRFNKEKQLDESRQGVTFNVFVMENPHEHSEEYLDMIAIPHGKQIFEEALTQYNEDPDFRKIVESDVLNEKDALEEKKKKPNTLIRESGLIL